MSMRAGVQASSPDATPARAAGRQRGADRVLAAWLLGCCALVFVMVVLGGVTRLTHSGLSMVEWRPLGDWLPPHAEADWQRAFEQYQHYPEFQELNREMTLEGFKSIYWLEFAHRLWGRLIGAAFLLPLVCFVARGRISAVLGVRLAAIFALGAAQGVLGWYMVMSGLIERPDVSAYRLAAHLALACLVYGYMLWVAFDLLWPPPPSAADRGSGGAVVPLLGLIAMTVLSGGLVAGLDAGFAYNTFPFMGGRLLPEHWLAMQPRWRNFFENIATVQFTHRVLAMATFAAILGWWLGAGRRAVRARLRLGAHVLALAGIAQVTLGISTLLLRVPLALAAAHQAGALLLLTAAIWVLHERKIAR